MIERECRTKIDGVILVDFPFKTEIGIYVMSTVACVASAVLIAGGIRQQELSFGLRCGVAVGVAVKYIASESQVFIFADIEVDADALSVTDSTS